MQHLVLEHMNKHHIETAVGRIVLNRIVLSSLGKATETVFAKARLIRTLHVMFCHHDYNSIKLTITASLSSETRNA